MSGFELVSNITCRAKSKHLLKSWWQANVNKLALVALETQTKLKLKNVLQTISFSVSIVGELEIQELNQNYRQINKITDVLSFPSLSQSVSSAEAGIIGLNLPFTPSELELGDIFICLKKVFSQAEAYNHSYKREAAFLFVHGFLHLLGYDHLESKEEKEMFSLQDKILERAGLPRE